ncbi:MAG: pyrroline-5-carboxylate reductase [Candidatus Planktophila sp.]
MANQQKVAVIGAGVMGEALIAALIRAGISPASISIVEKRLERANELIARYGITQSPLELATSSSDVILLVVKPQDMENVLQDIKNTINKSALVMSFAAGKKIGFIADHLRGNQPIVRIMPNTPTSVGLGAAGYSYGPGVTQEQKRFVTTFLAAAGVAVEVDESLQDAITATSGSGPAYFFAFVEAMISAATRLGLDESSAKTLVSQTLVGAAAMLDQSGKEARELRENVTSPNGTTAAALNVFNANKLDEIVYEAMKAARERSIELSN